MRSLRSALIDEPLPRLLAIAEAWDLFVEAASPRELAEKLPSIMTDAANIGRAQSMLPPEALAALDVLLEAEGRMPVAVFERRFGVLRQMGPGKLERERPWINPANVTETLWYRGFIFRGFDRSTPPSTVYYFAEALRQALDKAAQAKQHAQNIKRQAAQSDINLESTKNKLTSALVHNAFLDDVVTALAFIQNNEVLVKANGEWHPSPREALLPMLHAPDLPRFALLLHLLRRMKWLRDPEPRNDAQKLRLSSQLVVEWLQSPAEAQLRSLYEAWRNDPSWNDLACVPGLLFDMAHTWRNDPLREREKLLKLWAEWLTINQSAQQALNAASFADFVRQTQPDFARPDGRYDTWHIRDTLTRDFLHGFAHWDRIEGGLIHFVVDGPLRWFTPQPMLQAPTPPQSTPQLTIQPNATISVGPHQRFERFQLARVADWVSSDTSNYHYCVTLQSLARAKEQGIVPERVIDFLQRNSKQSLPGHLKMAIQRWGERGTELKFENMLVIKTKDVATLDQILSLPALHEINLERLTPTCVICQQIDRESIQKAIVQNGLLM